MDMDRWTYFVWLSGQSVDGPELFVAAILLPYAVGVTLERPNFWELLRARGFLLLLPLLCSFAAMLLGTFYEYGTVSPASQSHAHGGVTALFFAQTAILLAFVWRFREYRCFAVTVGVVEGWIAIVTCLVAQMSIMNAWF